MSLSLYTVHCLKCCNCGLNSCRFTDRKWRKASDRPQQTDGWTHRICLRSRAEVALCLSDWSDLCWRLEASEMSRSPQSSWPQSESDTNSQTSLCRRCVNLVVFGLCLVFSVFKEVPRISQLRCLSWTSRRSLHFCLHWNQWKLDQQYLNSIS